MILRFFFINILFLISTQVISGQAKYEIEKTDLEWREQLDEMSYLVLRNCLLYTSPSPRDRQKSRMPSSA